MNRIQYLLVAFCFMALMECAAPVKIYKYDLSLTEEGMLKDSSSRYGDRIVKKITDSAVTNYYYSDSILEITFWIEDMQFAFILKNKTDSTLKIVWDSIVYVNANGLRQRVIHSGINFFNKLDPQQPALVAKESSLSESILPADNINYDNVFKEWRKDNLITTADSGKSIQILFPVEINGSVHHYTFRFTINTILVEEKPVQL